MTPVGTLELVLLLLALVIVLELAARRIGLPPAAAFIVGGALLAAAPLPVSLSLDPALVLVLFLPPLLLSSAYFTDWRDLWAERRILAQLAIGAVIFTTLAVAWATHLVFPALPLAACVTLGAIVSPPDAVAAKAVLGRLPLPRRMVHLLEGESLLNDATGLVIYAIAVSVALGAEFSLSDATLRFVLVSVGGGALGAAAGWLAAHALARLRDPQLGTLLSLLAAWMTYIAAERMHVSGVLATVACGLVMGTASHATLAPRDRLQAKAVWRTVVFVLESLVFILIGLELREIVVRAGGLAGGVERVLLGAVAVVAVVVVSRLAWVIGTTYLVRWIAPGLRRRDPYPRIGIPIVMSWAGMRGVVSLAAALALPATFPGRDFILIATFAVIVATVLLQAPTLEPLAKRFDLGGFDRPEVGLLDLQAARAEVAVAQARAAEAAGTDEATNGVAGIYRRRAEAAAKQTAENDGASSRAAAIHAANRAGRARLLALHQERRLADGVLQALEHELDVEVALTPDPARPAVIVDREGRGGGPLAP